MQDGDLNSDMAYIAFKTRDDADWARNNLHGKKSARRFRDILIVVREDAHTADGGFDTPELTGDWPWPFG